MKILICAMIICLVVCITPATAATQNDFPLSEEEQLLLSYLGFGMAWSDELCNPRAMSNERIDTIMVKWFRYLYPDWENLPDKVNIYLHWKKRSDFLASSFTDEGLSAFTVHIDEHYEIPDIIRGSTFCARMKELESMADDYLKNKKISDVVSNEDYILMSYTSFINVWSTVLFNNQKPFHGLELLKSTTEYYAAKYINNVKYYNNIFKSEFTPVKQFYSTIKSSGVNFQAYMDTTPLFKSWTKLDKQAYEFFSNRVGK